MARTPIRLPCTRPVLAVAWVLTVGVTAAPGLASATAGDRVAPPGRTVRLSDERTLSFWAHAVSTAPARRHPKRSARAVARLRFYTEDRQPEVYLALAAHTADDGSAWVRVRLPQRPNGTTGWVRRGALGPLHATRRFLQVNRRTLRATLYHDGRRIWRARIGVGTPSTPTPRGRFYVREKLRNLGGAGVYGPLAFGTSAYSTLSDWPNGGVIGIHGTDQPALIPGRPSHGCIRVRNRKIAQLGRLLRVGTPVRIL